MEEPIEPRRFHYRKVLGTMRAVNADDSVISSLQCEHRPRHIPRVGLRTKILVVNVASQQHRIVHEMRADACPAVQSLLDVARCPKIMPGEMPILLNGFRRQSLRRDDVYCAGLAAAGCVPRESRARQRRAALLFLARYRPVPPDDPSPGGGGTIASGIRRQAGAASFLLGLCDSIA